MEPQPWLDQSITLREIAATLETITHIMTSEGLQELAGHNASWFTDAALIIEQLDQQRK